MEDHPSPDPLTLRAGRFAVGVLAVDAVLHVYWLTGATWPFPDERALSLAVLGYPVPFTARILVPLAILLGTAATALLRRLHRGPGGAAGRAAHCVTLVVVAAAAVQLPFRIDWAMGFGSGGGPVFRWLNLVLYLPLCALLALAAYRVARHGTARGRWRHRMVLALPVLLASTVAFAAYTYKPGSGDYPAVADARSRFLDTGVARFHYLREGSGPPLVLLPGGTASAYAWQPQFEALSATHTVYVVDLPGQGYTEPKDPGSGYNLPAMETAIGAFLDAAGLDRVDLAGHSWSGGWALSYAQSHPDRVNRLILLASSGLDVPDVAGWEVLKTPVVGELLVNFGYTRAAVRSSIPDLFVHKEKATPALVEAMWRPLTVRENLRSVYELERGLDWRRTESRMPTTVQPALIIWGAQDTILPAWQAGRFAELMPHAQMHIIDGCGHAITLDCPDEVTGLMRAFSS